MVLETIIENENYEPADQAGLKLWADTYALTIPVISDANSTNMYTYATGGVGLPFTVLLDRGVVVDTVTASEADIDPLLDGE